MPGMDGIEVCREIKSDQMLNDIPIIMVTGLDSHKDRVRGIEAGVDDYFSKPFDQTVLLSRIKILLKMKKLNDERKRAESQREAALRALQKSYDELDYQVQVRTAELAKANEMLQAEIEERKRNEEMIRIFAITDELTSLYNRRGFTTLVEQQLRVAERTKNDMLLFFADLDGLKQINDTLGHKSGDKAIVEASNVLKEVFRKMDIIARMGGDEFAVLAPKASLEHSGTIKNRLRNQIDVHNSRAGRDYNLSLSIGMACYDSSTPRSLNELISHADSLMYEEKRRRGHLC